jgi:hypothetical protein
LARAGTGLEENLPYAALKAADSNARGAILAASKRRRRDRQ